jgi:hypothetical protein
MNGLTLNSSSESSSQSVTAKKKARSTRQGGNLIICLLMCFITLLSLLFIFFLLLNCFLRLIYFVDFEELDKFFKILVTSFFSDYQERLCSLGAFKFKNGFYDHKHYSSFAVTITAKTHFQFLFEDFILDDIFASSCHINEKEDMQPIPFGSTNVSIEHWKVLKQKLLLNLVNAAFIFMSVELFVVNFLARAINSFLITTYLVAPHSLAEVVEGIYYILYIIHKIISY